MKTYIWQCAIRVILVSLALTGACWLLLVPQFYFTALLMLLVAVSLFFNLIGFMRRRFRRSIDFLQAIRNDDFPLQYNTAIADPDTKELHTLLNELSDRFKALRFENEARTRLLDVLLDHIPTAVLIVDHYGNIPVMNRTAMRLLQLKGTENIDVLQASMPELLEKISGESKEESFTISLKTVAGTQQLNGAIYPFQSGGLSFQLISLQDITSQLNRQEVESWQKLMKVLTHEVMNSLTPVISLAGTASQLLQTPIDTETQEELRQAIEVIESRGTGILDFIQAFRSLSNIPAPKKTRFSVSHFYEHLRRLTEARFKRNQVRLVVTVEPPDLTAVADFQQLEQVFLNLIYNALEAMENTDAPMITLDASLGPDNLIVLQVSDNGKGIEPAMMDRIFIPFFSTKANGTGVGLSVSKQIIALHDGTIEVVSEEGVGTAVVLRW